MAAAAAVGGNEGDFEPPPPSSLEHGGGRDSGQGGGLVFRGDGGQPQIGEQLLCRGAPPPKLTICKRIPHWGDGWGWWTWLSGR